MLTKGIILGLGTSNKYLVRIPLFETVAEGDKTILEATAVIPPGIFNGYQKDDVVFIGFENDSVDRPVILGKLYLGPTKENYTEGRGAIKCNSLTISNNKENIDVASNIKEMGTLKNKLELLGSEMKALKLETIGMNSKVSEVCDLSGLNGETTSLIGKIETLENKMNLINNLLVEFNIMLDEVKEEAQTTEK